MVARKGMQKPPYIWIVFLCVLGLATVAWVYLLVPSDVVKTQPAESSKQPLPLSASVENESIVPDPVSPEVPVSYLKSTKSSPAPQQNQAYLREKHAIKGEHDSYRRLRNVYALQLKKQETIPYADGVLVEKKGGYHFYQTSVAQSEAYLDKGEAVHVVENQRTGGLGILTGTLILKMKDMAEADALIQDYAESYSIQETQRFPQTGLYYLFIQTQIAELPVLLAKFKTDPRIERVVPEVLEHASGLR